MPPDTSSARTLARRLVARGAASGGAPTGAVAACERAYHDLERWVGPSGCRALFARAIAQARSAHPPLVTLRPREGAAPGLDGIDAAVARFGTAAVDAALEAMLDALIALLGRVIGDDMTERLLDPPTQSAPRAADAPDDPAAAPDAPREAPREAIPE